MACSKQKPLEAYFNVTSNSEKRKIDNNETDEPNEPTGKKQRPFTRKYDPTYIKFGFVSSEGDCPPKPVCVICKATLSNDAMKPSKMLRHLETKHPHLKEKSEDFFKRKQEEMKYQKKMMHSTVTGNEALMKASYLLSYNISKCQAPFTSGEKLIMPSVIDACREVLGPAAAAKVSAIPLSNDTVSRRIGEMADDIECQVLDRVRASDWFAIQLDETTDISNLAILLVYVRYMHEGIFQEEFLCCKELPQSTTAGEIFRVLNEYITGHGLLWERCIGICTDGAAAMTGRHSGVVARVKAVAPDVQGTHCIIHREVLASKRLSPELNEVLSTVVKMVNFIKANATNSRIFTALCDEMGAEHHHLLLHAEVRWLSRGKVVNRVYELRREIEAFLLQKKKDDLAVHFRDPAWIAKLAYLSDIFDQFNQLNLSIQGRTGDIFQTSDKIAAFKKKLRVWKDRVERSCFDMFPLFSSLVDEGDLDVSLVGNIIGSHLKQTLLKFEEYFPSQSDPRQGKRWIRDPFSSPETDSSLPAVLEDKLLELSCDEGLRIRFNEMCIQEFWLACCGEYPELCDIAVKTLLPFHSTYLCETGFSSLTATKTKYRNRLASENTLRISLSSLLPRFDRLVSGKQAHPSH